MAVVPADILGPLTTRQGLGGRGNYDPQQGHAFYRTQDLSMYAPFYSDVQTNKELLERTSDLDEIQKNLKLSVRAQHQIEMSFTERELINIKTRSSVRNLRRTLSFSRYAVASPGGILGFFLMFDKGRAVTKQLKNRTLFDSRHVMLGQEIALIGPPQFMRCYVCTRCFVLHEKGGTFGRLGLHGKQRENISEVRKIYSQIGGYKEKLFNKGYDVS